MYVTILTEPTRSQCTNAATSQASERSADHVTTHRADDTAGKMAGIPLDVYRSPLTARGAAPAAVKRSPRSPVLRSLEGGFLNDGVKAQVLNRSRRRPIIPPYEARDDPASTGYFQTALAQAVLNLTLSDTEIPPARKSFNKLSSRRRCKKTPTPGELTERENTFINDAIPTEKRRTPFKDTLLPKYDGQTDPHSQSYFRRSDVTMLVNQQKFRELPVMSRRHRPLTPVTPSGRSSGSGQVGRSSRGQTHASSPSYSERTPYLSTQQQVNWPPTPSRSPGRHHGDKENSFINDAIVTDKRRSRFKDIIPPYDAARDAHAQSYFDKTDVRRLMSVTCNA